MDIDLLLPIAPSSAFDAPEQLALVRLADEMTFRRVWVRDIVLHAPDDPDGGAGYELFCHLAFLAAATRRLRLGSAVVSLGVRDPILLAKQVASVQALSGGRFELGLGAGHRACELAAYGIDPQARWARFEEQYRTLMSCLETGRGCGPAGVGLRMPPGRPAPMPEVWIACRPDEPVCERLACSRFLFPFLPPAEYGEAVCRALARGRSVLDTAMSFFIDCDPDATGEVRLVRRGALPVLAGAPGAIAGFLRRYRSLGLGAAMLSFAGARSALDQLRDFARHVARALP